jgi:hypothetical protein
MSCNHSELMQAAGCEGCTCEAIERAERAEARVVVLESHLEGVEGLERLNEEGYERDIRALRARVAELEALVSPKTFGSMGSGAEGAPVDPLQPGLDGHEGTDACSPLTIHCGAEMSSPSVSMRCIYAPGHEGRHSWDASSGPNSNSESGNASEVQQNHLDNAFGIAPELPEPCSKCGEVLCDCSSKAAKADAAAGVCRRCVCACDCCVDRVRGRLVPRVEIDSLRTLLRDLEWSGSVEVDYDGVAAACCPGCGGIKPGEDLPGPVFPNDPDHRPERYGHRDGCELVAALAPLRTMAIGGAGT